MTGSDDPLGRGSKLNPIKDPNSSAGQLARALRDLVGGESLRQLAPRVPCGVTTISDALSGDPRKVPTVSIIEGICKACGADASTLARLLDMRAQASRSRPPDPPPHKLETPDPPPSGTALVDPLPPEPETLDPPPYGPTLRRRLLVLLCVALVGLVATGQPIPIKQIG
jgi:hypothetical protein